MKFFSPLAKIYFLVLLFFGITIANTSVQAHPGRTDSSGCHTCRTNCSSWGLSYGEYHCHRAKTSIPQPVEPIRSKYGENGTGYTTPAPDYKIPKKSENLVKPEFTKIEEPKPGVKSETPKSQEASEESKKSFFTKVSNFFSSVRLKINNWFK